MEIPSKDNVLSDQDWTNMPKIPQIKHIDLVYSTPIEWLSMGENEDLGIQMLTNYISKHPGLETFKLRLIRYHG